VENKSDDLNSGGLHLTDEDFQIGHLLANNHFNHAVRLYHLLPKVSIDGQAEQRLNQFFNLLPDTFQKKEATFVTMNMKFSARTATNYLKKLVESGMLTQEQRGEYKKAT